MKMIQTYGIRPLWVGGYDPLELTVLDKRKEMEDLGFNMDKKVRQGIYSLIYDPMKQMEADLKNRLVVMTIIQY